MAAGNRQGDRGVTYSMPAPLANRFSHYEVEINLDDWVAWAYANEIDERIIAFLRFRQDLLFEFDPSQNPVAFPSPRSWEFAHRALQKFDDHKELFLGALQACVGKAAGIEVLQFINEPVAAVLAYDARPDSKLADKITVVADLGGTRSDVAVIASRGGIYTILSTIHDYDVSGFKLDQVLIDHFAKEFLKKHKTGADPRDGR